MFLKIFFLAFVLIAAASIALGFGLLLNRSGKEEHEACLACGTDQKDACTLHEASHQKKIIIHYKK